MKAIEKPRHDRAALLGELQAAGADTSKPSAIRCPFHEDYHPSGGVYERERGVAVQVSSGLLRLWWRCVRRPGESPRAAT